MSSGALIWVDYAILVIIGISAAMSLVRGFIREALSLAGWVAAFWIALTFGDDLAVALEAHVSVPSVRQALSFAALFVATLLATGLVTYVVGLFVEKTGLSGTDRMLGILFGVVRGAVIVGLLVLMAAFTPLPQDPWWSESVLLPHFERLAVAIRDLLPPDLAAQFGLHT